MIKCYTNSVMNSTFELKEIKPLNSSGSVMLVQDAASDKLLVRKVLKVYDESVYKYLTEHHPKGIPDIISVESTSEGLVVIEEYIQGYTLKEILSESGPPEMKRARDVLISICDILTPLHLATPAIVHRDIKPSNILIAVDGSVYLLDFNAATEFKKEKDYDTVLIGTTGYAAPEQYGFKASDPRADVYAIGRVAQELFTGEKSLPENYSGPYKEIITKCLNLDPNNRYANARDLKKALQSGRPNIPTHKWYIPPGFRTRTTWKMVLASVLYVVGFIAFFPVGSKYEPLRDRSDVFAFFVLVVMILFFANYMDIHSHLPLASSRNLPTRIVGVVLYAGLLYLLMAILAVLLGNLGII